MAKPRRIKPVAEKFWRHVEKTDGCWNWTGYLRANGYGQFTVVQGDAPRLAHRVAWELTNGDIPEGGCCLHSCDNRRCVNPSHIFLGTRADNMADMHIKGRNKQPQGDAHVFAKLTREGVLDICTRLAAGERAVLLAQEYGVTRGLIYNVKNRNCWTHVT